MSPAAQHILVVDDDGDARDVIADLLEAAGYHVTTASDGETAVTAAVADPPDLVLTDVQMPRGDGYHVVRSMRSQRATEHIPILMFSGMGQAARRVEGLDLGADDFINKPVDAAELLARIRVHLRHLGERRQLERCTVSDPLTGVLNRRGITSVLHRELARADRTSRPLTVLMVDVDRFKQINDQHGHAAGDEVLRRVGRALEDAVRTADAVGRWGGDEFVVVLADTARAAAETLAGRLRELCVSPERDLVVTISIGVATAEPHDTIDALIERADREMYWVKRGAPAARVSALGCRR